MPAKRNQLENLINAKTKATLQKKAANSKYTYGQLAQVYRRGQGAYLSSGKSASMAAWAMGRVNSFIKGGHSQDNDLKKKVRSLVPKRKKVNVKLNMRRAYLLSIYRIKKILKALWHVRFEVQVRLIKKDVTSTSKLFKEAVQLRSLSRALVRKELRDETNSS